MMSSHYYREYYNGDIIWDAAQMILTMKLSSIAINYGDGGRPKESKTKIMLQNELDTIPAFLPYMSTYVHTLSYILYHSFS